MLWGQQIKVYTDHMNLIRDALGLTSDRVYQWRLLLEEYALEIVYIKGIHNTVVDAISRLKYNPEINPTDEQNFANLGLPSKGHPWKGFTALWRSNNKKNPGTHGQDCNLNYVFANHSEEEEIYPLTAQEVADAQRVAATIKHCFKSNHVFDKDFDIRLVDETSVVCKNGRMVIPKPLQRCAVLWFHKRCVDYDYKIGNRVLVIQDGILRKAQSPHSKEPWTITTVHMNGTIRIQRGTKTERINIWRVTPYTDE
jgi:hypothetical protein